MIRTFHFLVTPVADGVKAADEIRNVIAVIAPHMKTLHGAVVVGEASGVRFELKVAGQKGYLLATNAKHVATQILIKARINPRLATHVDTSKDKNRRELTLEEGRTVASPRPRGWRNPDHVRGVWQGDVLPSASDVAGGSRWTWTRDDR